MACARLSLLNASTTIASEAGTSMAAPSAWTTRPATRTSRLPATAHHATTEMHDSTHVYTTKYELTICVYDAAGNVLGELTDTHWD